MEALGHMTVYLRGVQLRGDMWVRKWVFPSINYSASAS